MRLKAVPLVFLIVLIASLPAMALDSRALADYAESPMAIAWRERDTIYVAVVNEYTSRYLYRIEIYDAQRRDVLAQREVLVPGKSILIESFESRDLRYTPYPIKEVGIYAEFYGRRIKIQDHSMFVVQDYLIPANASFTVEVDLGEGASSGRIMVDEYTLFYTCGNPQMNQAFTITIPTSRIRRPATLTMRAPYLRNVDVFSSAIAPQAYGETFPARCSLSRQRIGSGNIGGAHRGSSSPDGNGLQDSNLFPTHLTRQ